MNSRTLGMLLATMAIAVSAPVSAGEEEPLARDDFAHGREIELRTSRPLQTLLLDLPVYRGTGQRYALRAAESILAQGGVLGIAPEGGSWATVLRPARPGAAFLAARTGATILPVGIDGADQLFPSLGKLRRARVTARIGKPYGPFQVEARGKKRREQLDELGHEIMRRIADLIPPEKRGYYSDDPAIREAAKGTEIFPEYEALEG